MAVLGAAILRNIEMIFLIMLVGVCAAFAIDADKPATTNVVLCVLCVFCFSLSAYIEFFLTKK